MEASEVKHADLKKGQLRNLLVATFASIFAYWAWSVISPLAKFYSSPDQMHLDEGGSSLLIAMPVLVGAVGRIPAGALTDKYGGRVMLTAVMALSAPLTLLVALAGSMKSFGYCRYRVRSGYPVQCSLVRCLEEGVRDRYLWGEHRGYRRFGVCDPDFAQAAGVLAHPYSAGRPVPGDGGRMFYGSA